MINKKIITIDITPDLDSEINENGGIMWEHNATLLKFVLDSKFVGDYKYYIEYRSLMGTRVRTEYLELNTEDNSIVYNIPITMSSLKGVECYFNIVRIDEDGNTIQVVKPRKFGLTFDYSYDTDNHLCKINDFSINSLLEAIRLGTFKGDQGEKGDKGDRGEKGDTGGISEEHAVDNFCNVFKGEKSGFIVSLEDISPIQHEIKVNVRSKNLFDISKISDNSSVANNNDGSLTVVANGYSVNTNKKLQELCPSLKAGDVCTLTLKTDSTFANFIFLSGLGRTWNSGASVTITDEMLNSEFVIYGRHTSEEDYGQPTVISDIQIELGDVSTPFVPYLNPVGESLKKMGKNLLPYPYHETTKTENGVTFTDNGDGTITVNGTATADTTFYFNRVKMDEINLPPAIYTLSGCGDGASTSTYYCYTEMRVKDKNLKTLVDYGNGGTFDYSTLTASNIDNINSFLRIKAGFTAENLVVKPQLEYGNKATEYEKYVSPEIFVSDNDGNVGGVVTDIPNITLIPQSVGAILDCSYNKDINRIIDKIVKSIEKLGGQVE